MGRIDRINLSICFKIQSQFGTGREPGYPGRKKMNRKITNK
jgi:hypothetical protein